MNINLTNLCAILTILIFAVLLWLQDEIFVDKKSGAVRVVDGDSLELRGEQIRLKGIDAPEGQQTCIKGNEKWSCGRAATGALRAKISARDVDCKGTEFDRYERLLAYCTVGGVELNRWMVLEGWAVSYGGEFRGEEQKAKELKVGIWQGTFDMPNVWRRDHPRY